jgi:Protein of unknown function (DUF1573)
MVDKSIILYFGCKMEVMKRLSILIVLLAVGFYSSAQNARKTSGAEITWEKATHDFGDVFQGDKVEYTFRFTNTGKQDLVITNVEVTCGCTTPKGWPRDPVKPGDSGELTVAFNSAGKIGKQNKVITITSNSVGTLNQIMFTANVLEKKDSN